MSVLICAAGDIHGAIERLYDDVLAFEAALSAGFTSAVLDTSAKPPDLTSYWHVRACAYASSAIITLESTPKCRA